MKILLVFTHHHVVPMIKSDGSLHRLLEGLKLSSPEKLLKTLVK